MIKAAISLILGVSAALLPIRATAAEQIIFNFPPFGEFYIKVDDLETFVETGEVSEELEYYFNRLPLDRVERLSELLSSPLQFNPLTIANFSNSTVGETVIRNFGKGIRTETNQNGFLALRGAIIAAAFDSEGLTIINLLRQFPLKEIYVDFNIVERYIKRGEKVLKERELIDQLFFTENLDRNSLPKKENLKLSQLGKYNWQKQTYTYKNPRRYRAGYFDLYLPQKKQSPLVVISHGLASNRKTFVYLGEHLASQGFAVAIVEHDDISLTKFDGFLSGLERFPEPNNLIEQPFDIKYVLDKLEQKFSASSSQSNKINLQQVGVIGHSFGGYTSLVLAGGKLIADPQAEKCQAEDYQNVLLDLSSLAECTFNEFSTEDYQLKDPRVKAVIAMNAMGGVFGEAGISSIDVPTMFISGTNDVIMPPVAEQIKPFSWMNEDIDKYLVLVKPGTHFSFLREGLGVLPVPDRVVGISPTQAYPVIDTLATLFFNTYLKGKQSDQKYLENTNLNSLNLLDNNSFQLSIIRTLPNFQIQKLLED